MDRLVARNSISTRSLTTDDLIVGRSIVLTGTATIEQESTSGGSTPSNVVLTSGDQTINGVKTFVAAPVFSSGITLPTTGGVPSPLTFYQRFTGSIDFTSTAFAGTQTIVCHFARIGDIVTMSVKRLISFGSGANGLINGTAIPSQFWPLEEVRIPITVIDGSELDMAGFFQVNQSGISQIARGLVAVNFGLEVLAFRPFEGNVLGFVGFQPFSVSWIAA